MSMNGVKGFTGIDEGEITSFFRNDSDEETTSLFSDGAGEAGLKDDVVAATCFEVFSGITKIWEDLGVMASVGGLWAPSDKIELSNGILRYEDIAIHVKRHGASTMVSRVVDPQNRFYIYSRFYPSWMDVLSTDLQIALIAAPWFGISGVLREKMSDFMNAMNFTVERGRNIPKEVFRGDWHHFTDVSHETLEISRIVDRGSEATFEALKMYGFDNCAFCRCAETGKLLGYYVFQRSAVSFCSFVYGCTLTYYIPPAESVVNAFMSIKPGKDHFDPAEYDSPSELIDKYYIDIWSQLFPYLAFYGGVLCSDVFEAVRPDFESVDEKALKELARSQHYCTTLPVASTCSTDFCEKSEASIVDFCRVAIRVMRKNSREY